MDYTVAYVLNALGTVLVLFWAILFLKYKDSFDEILTTLNPEQFMLPELFFIGFGFIDMFKLNLRTESGRKKEKTIAEVYGEKYAPYYHYCIFGGQVTYALTIAPLGFFVGAITGDLLYAILVLGAAVAIIISLDMDINSAVEKKRDEMLCDYPEVLSKLTLLVNAGMIVREAWTKVAYTSERALYKEMQITSEEMSNGISEIDAFYNFSQRCTLKEMRKFASVLSQNLQKGGTELAYNLKAMNQESWEEKKHRAKRKGEAAGSKLLIPTMIIFVGILLMIIVPIFMNMF